MNFKAIVIQFVMIFILLSCGEKSPVNSEVDVYQIQSAGTLSTTEYTFGKILQLDDNEEWYKIGDRKILISVKAKVKAGIDLSKILDNDIVVKGSKISIQLPSPEIVSFEMNPNDIRTKMKDINGFRGDFTQEEKVKILQLGEQSIRIEMMSSQILHDAKKNASVFVRNFYQDMGFEHVEITFNEQENVIQEKL